MDKENEKVDTIESFEDIDLRMSCEPLPDIPASVPDYSSCDLPKIEFNEEPSLIFKVPTLDPIADIDSIKTKLLNRHAIATSDPLVTKVETLGKYSSDDIEEMYRQGLNDGMKRALEPDSPLVEIIIKKAADKLSKLKSGEWVILSKSLDLLSRSLDLPETWKIKYICSNCEKEFTRMILLRDLPNYCENCGSKNSLRYDHEKDPW